MLDDEVQENGASHENECNDSLMQDYEIRRAHNIERNNARLRDLGLISTREERESNAAAWGRRVAPPTPEICGSEVASKVKGKIKKRNVSKRCSEISVDDVPLRRSKRIKGEIVEHVEIAHDGEGDQLSDNSTTEEEREERVRECREARLRAAQAVAEAGHELAAAKNPTATYDHCLMRVRSMTHKGLLNRVKAIERAVGKHCVVKMAIFKCCLQDEGLWELAQVAGDALERLKPMLPPLSPK